MKMATLLATHARFISRRVVSLTHSTFQKSCFHESRSSNTQKTTLNEWSENVNVKERPTFNKVSKTAKGQGSPSGKNRPAQLKDLRNNLKYEILSSDDPRLGRTILQVKSKSGQGKREEVIIEGARNIIDALRANAVLEAFYFSSVDVLQNFPLDLIPTETPLYKAPKFKLNLFSDLAISPGIVGIFKTAPEDGTLMKRDHVLPVTLIINGLRDPMLLGGLLQSAAAVGCRRVILMKGCVNLWSSKVVRSSGVSPFYVPIVSNMNWSQLHHFLKLNETIQVLIVKKERIGPGAVKHYGGSVEAVERLQELEEQIADESDVGEDDLQGETDEPRDLEAENQQKEDDELKIEKDELYDDVDHLKEYRKAPLSLQCYHNVDYTVGHSVVIIDEDYTLQSKKFAYDNHGQVVHFPMASQLYGLNTALAGNLVLFEADKQYRKVNESVNENAETVD